MGNHLDHIKQLLQQSQLTNVEKQALLDALSDAEKQWAVTDFKLDLTEKDNRKTAILLEETIEELEQKRKAVEAQNRELEIESSLERVRTVAMSMNKPDDMLEVCKTIALQLQTLGVPEIRNVQTAIFYPDRGSYMNYEYYAKHDKSFVTETLYTNHELAHAFAQQMIRGKDEIFITNFTAAEVKDWLAYQKTTNVFIDTFLENAPTLNYYWHSLGPVALGISTYQPLSDDALQLFRRYLKVFDLSYRRYLDIENAFAQARESQVEAALERVRSRSMAMHKSDELKDVIRLVLEQFIQLNINVGHSGFYIDYKEHDAMHIWLADPNIEPFFAIIPYFDTPTWNNFLAAKANGTNFYTDLLDFESKNKFYQSLFTLFTVPEEAKQFYLQCKGLAVSTVLLDNVGLYIENFEAIPYTEEENKILMRFAKAFQQTYTRFLDLQKAELQARESQIEAALERVRSRTLAMQKSDELAETAAVLFHQLILLGIEPNRLYIGIVNAENNTIEAWATDEQGGRVSARFILDTAANASVQKMFDGWKTKQSLVIDMQGDELKNYINYLAEVIHAPVTVGHTQKRRVQTIAYFSKGFIGIASSEPQPQETTVLLERFAAVFHLTYTRFNDLQIAEAHAAQAELDLIAIKEAKQKAEQALAELQATQKQLIQSEKMASLGELTAGIAHEIQNPLNFVNNFSEVSNELMEELQAERLKAAAARDEILENELLEDIKQNLEKINHHGQRAAAIVKGMLQHSRSSTGQKEPTDINALCDEYLRLAYHGLRAKDKSFNAAFQTHFDPDAGIINILPQEMGRVILNLINNAFYAVNEQAKSKKQKAESYEPTVTVRTKKEADTIVIKVADNGNGIPEHILHKIFQPFFTTKPTGQGTGLGLSLSYDIVKAHGGELKVETKDGEGTQFIIILPA